MREAWRDIPGFEGMYQVSNHGRVRSLDRVYEQSSSHGTMMHKRYNGQIINPTDNGKGYKIVSLKKNGARKNFYVHRLVAESFLENPFRYTEINHIDFDKGNNSVSNLEWISRVGNIHHSLKNMMKPRKNSKLPASTNEKYIRKRKYGYELNISRKGKAPISRTFKTLEDAVAMREVIIGVEKPVTA